MIRMENDTEFVWPETGTLKIRNSGESQISLRYMPSLDVIARELGKHRKKASKRSHCERQQNTHRKTMKARTGAANGVHNGKKT